MAIPGNIQALIAAFTFGIVVNAASGAAFLYVKGHGSTFFRNGPRLALVLFLVFSALWAQTGFIAFTLEPGALMGCQAVVAIASAFDQLARVSIAQFLHWGVNSSVKTSAITAVSQLAVLARFILGGAFVAIQRPQFKPVCVASTMILPLGITVLAIDAFLVAMFLARGLSVGLLKDIREPKSSNSRSKAIILITGGLAVWTATSVPMILGIKSIDLMVRTAIPGTGLSILIALIAIFNGCATLSREEASMLSLEGNSWEGRGRDIPTRDTSSRDLPTADSFFPPDRYEQVKGETTTFISAGHQRALSNSNPNTALPSISRPTPGQAMAGIGGMPVQGQLFPPARAQTEPVAPTMGRSASRPVKGHKKGGKYVISNPVLNETGEQNPLHKIATIDLATAAKNERDRRDMAPQGIFSDLVASNTAAQPPALSPEEMIKRGQSVKRKDVGGALSSHAVPNSSLEPAQDPKAAGTSSSAQLSPGVEEIRRRSPRHPSQSFQQQGPSQSESTGAQSSRSTTPPKRPERPTTLELPMTPPKIMTVLMPPPRSPRRPVKSSLPKYKPESPPRPAPAEKSQSPRRSTVGPVRRDRAGDLIFTDPRAPPAIPTRHAQRESSQARSIPTRHQAAQDVPPKTPAKNTPPSSVSSTTATRPSGQGSGSPRKTNSRSVAVSAPVRAASGQPTGLRKQAMTILAKEQGLSKEQTVLFLKSIEYNNPDAVRMAMDGDKHQQAMAMLANNDEASVVNRPRPIPRKPSPGRDMFPTETYGHRRSLSGGSIKSKKSILQSTAGSPTQLPPLPPLPWSAGNGLRPQPNNTKSMTFDEKMDIFFPMVVDESSGATENTRRRSSSVPELPTLPAEYRSVEESTNPESASQSAEQQTDKSAPSSVRTRSILDMSEAASQPSRPSQPAQPEVGRNTSKFSMATTQSPGEEPYMWASRGSFPGSKRQSSPVLPISELASPSVSSEARTRDDETTNWGSVHSPVAAVNIQRVRAVEVAPVIKSANDTTEDENTDTHASEEHEQAETVTVMLDRSGDREIIPPRESPSSARVRPTDDIEVQWHRRVGDACPTFSDREKTRSRKMVPPTPLMLNKPPKAVMLVEAEPSPLESPQHAIEMIQAQLRRLDDSNRESTGSDPQRMTLLANLEMEMGMQENHWQQMRDEFSRDSLSTVKTSPNRDSHYENALTSSKPRSGEFSLKSIIAERRASRQDRLRSRSSTSSSRSSQDSSHSISTQWKQTLAEAQAEYMDNKSDLVAKAGNSMSLLTVNASLNNAQLGSPTPPDTDESSSGSDSEGEAMVEKPRLSDVSASLLWHPISSGADLPSGDATPLWAPGADDSAQSPGPVSSGVATRAVTKKFSEPTMIESLQLWESPQTTTQSQHPTTLWNAVSAPAPEPIPKESPKKAVARPVTQRPPRRAKRVTLLPDILENPEPLPNKRGTLGIFQFPWGEKSDTGAVQPRPQMIMAMPGTMTSGRSTMTPVNPTPINPVLSSQLGTFNAQEYSSSFFDDYDEEDEGDNFSDYEQSDDDDDEEDDAFDDNTLWEIASLLKTDNVPSRGSLFPDQVAEIPRTNPYDEFRHEFRSSMNLGTDELSPRPRPSMLWDDQASSEEAKKALGVEPPDEKIWNCYTSLVLDQARTPLRRTRPAPITSTSMWSPSPSSSRPSSLLWASSRPTSDHGKSPVEAGLAKDSNTVSTSQVSVSADMMWSPPSPTATSVPGLPQPDMDSWDQLKTSGTIVRAKTRAATPASVESTSLWSIAQLPNVSEDGHLWNSPGRQEQDSPTLWIAGSPSEMSFYSGIPQPDAETWQLYLPDSLGALRAKPRSAIAPASLQSTELWSTTQSMEQSASLNRIWISKNLSPPAMLGARSTPASGCGMWLLPAAAQVEEPTGLFDVNHQRLNYRTSSMEPAASTMVLKKRAMWKSIEPLESTTLWSSTKLPTTPDWITMSSIRPSSPSIASSSSDTASPTTDASSIKSDVTKASTFGDMFADLSSRFRRRTGSNAKPKPQILGHGAPDSKPLIEVEAIPERKPVRKEQPRAKAVVRQAATESEWAAALKEAVEAGQRGRPVPAPKDDVVFENIPMKTSPSLKSATNQLWIHPAAVLATPEPVQLATMWQRPGQAALNVKTASIFTHDTRSTISPSHSRKEPEPSPVDFRGQTMWCRAAAAGTKRRSERKGDWLQRRSVRGSFQVWLPVAAGR